MSSFTLSDDGVEPEDSGIFDGRREGMNEKRLDVLIAYLRALAELKKAGHHVTLEINDILRKVDEILKD